MSERSSFVTEYIYCSKCFEAAKAILSGDEKYLCAGQVKGYQLSPDGLPIVAGKHGGLGAKDDWGHFQKLMRRLSERICHPMRVAFIPESGPAICMMLRDKKAEVEVLHA